MGIFTKVREANESFPGDTSVEEMLGIKLEGKMARAFHIQGAPCVALSVQFSLSVGSESLRQNGL